eukprot:TRINITY_DN2536_c0_g1_i3.p2 TRINITY_DN2536_c0_g1~~TRINITY_DN2536_c0_g1_i3.p2  ORF type:complete len:160 (+),score=12.34 TRINITY_DN2536_c0_g1_i3:125-604(+)
MAEPSLSIFNFSNLPDALRARSAASSGRYLRPEGTSSDCLGAAVTMSGQHPAAGGGGGASRRPRTRLHRAGAGPSRRRGGQPCGSHGACAADKGRRWGHGARAGQARKLPTASLSATTSVVVVAVDTVVAAGDNRDTCWVDPSSGSAVRLDQRGGSSSR